MEKLFYDANDLIKLTGYSESKVYKIIKDINQKIKERAKSQGREVIVFSGKVRKEYFDELTLINQKEVM